MIALATALFVLAAPPEPAAQPIQATTPLEVSLKGGKVEGPRTFRIKRGDEVILRIASDRKIALHLHGYDIERTAEPDKPAVFAFTAQATGRGKKIAQPRPSDSLSRSLAEIAWPE